ncbi:hypothetical protein LTEGF4_12690 [Limnohabitans sp. TEGF004]|nr:hypothetical protein LTEGF4_12690 [Limnohabitans sp. TEGF004]
MSCGQIDKRDTGGFRRIGGARCVDDLGCAGQSLGRAAADADGLTVECGGRRPPSEVDDDAIRGIAKVCGVVARATNEGVVARAAAQHVIACAAVDGVVACTAGNEFIGGGAWH